MAAGRHLETVNSGHLVALTGPISTGPAIFHAYIFVGRRDVAFQI
jgi:hypothetical protein